MDQPPPDTPTPPGVASATSAPTNSTPVDAAPAEAAAASSETPNSIAFDTAPPTAATVPVDYTSHHSEPKRTSNRGLIVGVSCLTILLATCIIGLVYWISSGVRGTELNVALWQTRRFSYLRDPFSHRQLTAIEHDTGGFTLDAAIVPHVQGGPIAPSVRWDLVEISHGAGLQRGDAHILIQYLTAGNTGGKPYWTEWTDKHATAAPILWAAVRDAVHLQRYDSLPDIFETARTETEPGPLKLALDKIMHTVSLNEARARLAANDQAGAQRAAKLGLRYGDSEELRGIAPQE